MDTLKVTKEAQEKRLKDFERIAKGWDSLPEYAKGKLDGTISTIAAVYLNDEGDKKAG